MFEVRRDEDGELCGHVQPDGERWLARTVFGGLLGAHDERAAAERQVLDDGLASMADRWTLRHGETGEEEVVCIQEANPRSVTLARGHYSVPGVPTLLLTTERLASGEWVLLRGS